jgi:16S rRNA (uracil1498-N3)-methyltransferase
MARFFVPQLAIEGGQLRVEGEEARHLRKVLRLRVGDAVSVFDGSGREAEGVIERETTASALIRVDRVTLPGKESSLDVILAQSLLKGEKMDLVVRKAVELGVSAIVPFVSSRSVPSLDDAGKRGRSRRWEKIAVEACKQCGRERIPPVEELQDFERMLRSASPEALRLFLWEEEGERLRTVLGNAGRKGVFFAVGPEGGFSAGEAAAARAEGFVPVTLGRRILRSETASLFLLSVLQYEWGDMG